ncbi:MAG TPA: hypothetical protein VFD00_05990 [Thermoclostridium sp.]|nr:hypothetical protein [Thermoclostridium sp.]
MENSYLTKTYIINILKEVCSILEYSPPQIIFIPDDIFMGALCSLPVTKLMMDSGAFKDFHNEYASFVAMGSGKIFISLDRANKFLKGFSEDQVYEYLKYVLGHEVGHMMDYCEDPIENELIACKYGAKVSDMKVYEELNKKIWKPIYDFMEGGGTNAKDG